MVFFEFINSVGTFGALCAAVWQLWRGRKDARARDGDRRVERALEMFDDVVAGGETAEAFHRLSVALRAHGSERHGVSTWHRLQDSDLTAGRFLDAEREERDRLFADLYTVLWFFERVDIALQRQLVDDDVLMQTLGFHFWWWGQVLLNLDGPKASASIHRLSLAAERWAAGNGMLDDWHRRCLTDFDGSGPKQRRMGDRQTATADGASPSPGEAPPVQ